MIQVLDDVCFVRNVYILLVNAAVNRNCRLVLYYKLMVLLSWCFVVEKERGKQYAFI